MYGRVFKKIKFVCRRSVIFFCGMFLYVQVITAGDITEFEVTDKEGVYYINASIVLDVPSEYVRYVLTDYVHIYRLNSSIIESEVLASPDGIRTRVRTKVMGCVLSYCEDIERVEDVHVMGSGDIRAVIVPEYSQFKSGITLWKIQSMGDKSVLTYHAEMEPDFFIPPIIGRFIVKAKLRSELIISFSLLEKIANIQSERDWDPDWLEQNWKRQ